MEFYVKSIRADLYPQLITIWESSVRSSHYFMLEEDIQFYKPLVKNIYMPKMDLYGLFTCENDELVGFIGLSEIKIEMLFIHPQYQGMGGGWLLCEFATKEKNAVGVDVNEQNTSARLFYESYGFQAFKRSAYDGSGRPYPIIHMRLP